MPKNAHEKYETPRSSLQERSQWMVPLTENLKQFQTNKWPNNNNWQAKNYPLCTIICLNKRADPTHCPRMALD